MPPIRHIFLDDGDVMNDNTVRGPQWRQLIGEFFVPRLGGTPEAWAAANLAIADELDTRYFASLDEGIPDSLLWRSFELEWLRSMAEIVGVATPADEEDCYQLARAAGRYIRPRVRSACPGAIEAIRELARDYELITASNEHSEVLTAYLESMGIDHLFRPTYYGPDLVGASKAGRFYERVFAHAGVDPAASLVLDDKLRNVESAVSAGARGVVVNANVAESNGIPVIGALADLPALLASGRLDTMPA